MCMRGHWFNAMASWGNLGDRLVAVRRNSGFLQWLHRTKLFALDDGSRGAIVHCSLKVLCRQRDSVRLACASVNSRSIFPQASFGPMAKVRRSLPNSFRSFDCFSKSEAASSPGRIWSTTCGPRALLLTMNRVLRRRSSDSAKHYATTQVSHASSKHCQEEATDSLESSSSTQIGRTPQHHPRQKNSNLPTIPAHHHGG